MRTRDFVRAAAVGVVMVAALAGADRLIASRLFTDVGDYVPAYRAFPNYTEGVTLEQLRSAGGRFNTLFAGDSTTKYGVNPDEFDASMRAAGAPTRSFNIAVPGVGAVYWDQLFRRYYDRPAPQVVLLGMTPGAVDARYVAATRARIRAFFASDGFRNRHMPRVERATEEALARASVLWGRRGEVRRLSLHAILRGKRIGFENEPHVVGDRGWARFDLWRSPTRASMVRSHALERHPPAARARELPVSRAAMGSLASLASWLRARGARLVLYTLPVYFDDNYPPGEAVRNGRIAAAALAAFARRERGVRFLDLRRRLAPRFGVQDYGNGNHLNERGARRFSRLLAGAVCRARILGCGPRPLTYPLAP